jgi:phage-related tail protein
MEISEIVRWAFEGILTFCGVYLVGLMTKITGAIEELNRSVATLIERTTNQEKRLDHYDTRIERLEDRVE